MCFSTTVKNFNVFDKRQALHIFEILRNCCRTMFGTKRLIRSIKEYCTYLFLINCAHHSFFCYYQIIILRIWIWFRANKFHVSYHTIPSFISSPSKVWFTFNKFRSLCGLLKLIIYTLLVFEVSSCYDVVFSNTFRYITFEIISI